jgi:Predicted transcription factor, homolog of eukaryotic MBF1
MAVLDAKDLVATAQFRAAIRSWFKESGMSQLRASMELGITQGLLNRLLSGKYAPSMAQAEKISHALGYELVDMLMKGRNMLN